MLKNSVLSEKDGGFVFIGNIIFYQDLEKIRIVIMVDSLISEKNIYSWGHGVFNYYKIISNPNQIKNWQLVGHFINM